jgi:hypothetical protein
MQLCREVIQADGAVVVRARPIFLVLASHLTWRVDGQDKFSLMGLYILTCYGLRPVTPLALPSL